MSPGDHAESMRRTSGAISLQKSVELTLGLYRELTLATSPATLAVYRANWASAQAGADGSQPRRHPRLLEGNFPSAWEWVSRWGRCRSDDWSFDPCGPTEPTIDRTGYQRHRAGLEPATLAIATTEDRFASTTYQAFGEPFGCPTCLTARHRVFYQLNYRRRWYSESPWPHR